MPRSWSAAEELANSLSHAAGFLGTLLLAPFLLSAGAHAGGGPLLGTAIFILTAAALYFCSFMHHDLGPGRVKSYFERLDHASIYLLIAGTYTPFALGPLQGPVGWTLLAVIWPLALLGVLLNLTCGLQHPALSNALYLGMGWLMLFALAPLSRRVPPATVWLIVAGGFAYTGGLAFYYARRLHFHHLAWHLCVLLGTALHALAIWHYAAHA